MKIEISPEAFNALVQEYEKYMDLYDQCQEEVVQDQRESSSSLDEFLKEQAFATLFETIGMVIAEVVEEGLDDWCDKNRAMIEAAFKGSSAIRGYRALVHCGSYFKESS